MSVRYFNGNRLRFPDKVREGDVWSSKGLRFEGGRWVRWRKRSNALDQDWRPEEDAQLREFFRRAYDEGDQTPQSELADRLGRTLGAVRSRADKLGITQTRDVKGGFVTSPRWTAQEEDLLRELYPKLRIKDLLEHFPGRSKGSIFTRANVLGLQGPWCKPWTKEHQRALRIAYERGIAIADVAGAMHRNPFSVSKYATMHGYDFGKRPMLADPPDLQTILGLADSRVPLPPPVSAKGWKRSTTKRQLIPEGERRQQERHRLTSRRSMRREQKREAKRQEAAAAREAARLQREAERTAAREERDRLHRAQVEERSRQRQAEVEERRRLREEERELARIRREQEGRDRTISIANARRSKAAKATARRKAEKILEQGVSIGTVRNPEVKFAYQALVAERAREHRQADPIEQAKLKLQRRYAPVCSMTVYGGKKGLYMIGTRKDVPEQELLAMAERLAA